MESIEQQLLAAGCRTELIYENPLAAEADIKDFIMEGEAVITFPLGRMRLENKLSEKEGQKANYVP